MNPKFLAIIVLAIMPMTIFVGCTEKQITEVDRVAGVAQTATQAAQAVLNSPAGQLVPPDYRLYGSLGISAILGVLAFWEEHKRKLYKKATIEIVRGIDLAKRDDANIRDAINVRQSFTQSYPTEKIVRDIRAA